VSSGNHPLEDGHVMGTPGTGGLHRRGDPGAVDGDPGGAMSSGGFGQCGGDAGIAGDISFNKAGADLGRHRLAPVLLQVQDRHWCATRPQRPGASLAQAAGPAGHNRGNFLADAH
jgi:hypothetical protein